MKNLKTWSTPVTPEQRAAIPCALCGDGRFVPSLSCEGFSYVRCGRCGLVQMNPQPSGGDVRRRYRESHGQDYLAYEIANEKAFSRLQELALGDAGFYGLERALMGRGSPPAILDVGC
ncbi:MAG: class I SAM-dependent methyltransferase, partial [Spirochaetaceae bacterium]|nr:class I SAM-dependent methyltransferase [Spirochaetaceae bacterium]